MELESIYLDSEEAMVALGSKLGVALDRGIVYLHGELGAGKTTLCRGILRSKGYQGAVKSPTYTLVEPYDLEGHTIFHFDLYRLSDPEELEFMGIRDYFHPDNLCIVEWPQRGEGVLPEADIAVSISVEGKGRRIDIAARTDLGEHVLNQL